MRFTTAIFSALAFGAMIVGCANEEQETRAVLYETAQNAVRDRMKIPKSTVFPELPDEFKITKTDEGTVAESDSISIFMRHRGASVRGYYESQNAMGVMLPGTFFVVMTYDSVAKKWEALPAELESDKE